MDELGYQTVSDSPLGVCDPKGMEPAVTRAIHSAMVGIFGALDDRLVVATAKARSRPVYTCGMRLAQGLGQGRLHRSGIKVDCAARGKGHYQANGFAWVSLRQHRADAQKACDRDSKPGPVEADTHGFCLLFYQCTLRFSL